MTVKRPGVVLHVRKYCKVTWIKLFVQMCQIRDTVVYIIRILCGCWAFKRQIWEKFGLCWISLNQDSNDKIIFLPNLISSFARRSEIVNNVKLDHWLVYPPQVSDIMFFASIFKFRLWFYFQFHLVWTLQLSVIAVRDGCCSGLPFYLIHELLYFYTFFLLLSDPKLFFL